MSREIAATAARRRLTAMVRTVESRSYCRLWMRLRFERSSPHEFPEVKAMGVSRMSECGWQQVHAQVRDLMERGFHCSEAFLLCVGGYVLGTMQPLQLRAATGFAGGFGCTYEGACGALTGVMVWFDLWEISLL
jgi:hypothetical protein